MKFNLFFEDGSAAADTHSRTFKKKWREKELEALRKHYGTKYRITVKNNNKTYD
ncbi:MAG: hypothetical protein J6C82_08685 [Clostridia bacterium]|nr:hypothetical protein [Clostridia bacterium]